MTFQDLPEAMRAEELAEFSRVPLETVRAEMDAGRLPVIQIGDEKRILKSMLIATGTPSPRSVGTRTSVEAPNEVEVEIGAFIRISDFEYRWPDGTLEHYINAHEANAKCLGRAIRVVIGSTERDAAGKQDRKRILVLVDGIVVAEFAGANDYDHSGLVAAVIKPDGASQRHLQPGEAIPPGYGSMSVSPYNQIVRGPHATGGLAVVCHHNDLETMARHALLRWASKQRRR